MEQKMKSNHLKVVPPAPPREREYPKREFKDGQSFMDWWKVEQERLEFYEDMRDNLMSLVRNSGMSFEDIHNHCGPCPATLQNWDDKKVKKPQLGKMYSTLQIIGKKFRDIER